MADIRLARKIMVVPPFDLYGKEKIHPDADKDSDEAIDQAMIACLAGPLFQDDRGSVVGACALVYGDSMSKRR